MPEVSKDKIYNQAVSIVQYDGFTTRESLIYNEGTPTIAPFSTNRRDGQIKLTARTLFNDKRLISTVSNVQNALGVHEYIGHGIKGYGDATGDHYKAYELQFQHKTWNKTTPYFKNYMRKNYEDYLPIR